MSSAHSLLEADVCVVGYALNAKKLRKSSHDRSLRSDCSPSRGNDKLDKHTMCAETTVIRKLSDAAACCMEHEWKGGGLADILDSNSLSSPQGKDRASVHFVQLDHDVPLASQPKCHVIIHKLTEDIDNPSKDSTAKIGALGAYLQHNPQTIIVDPIDSVRKVISRARTCNHLSEIQRHMQDRCPFTQPRYCVVEEKQSTADIANQLKALHFSYPIICKPVQACGTPNSHNMVSNRPHSLCAYIVRLRCVCCAVYDWCGTILIVTIRNLPIGDHRLRSRLGNDGDALRGAAVPRPRRYIVQSVRYRH